MPLNKRNQRNKRFEHKLSMYNGSLKWIRQLWISREPVAWPWYNLANNHRVIYFTCMNRLFSGGLLNYQVDTIEWACILYDSLIPKWPYSPCLGKTLPSHRMANSYKNTILKKKKKTNNAPPKKKKEQITSHRKKKEEKTKANSLNYLGKWEGRYDKCEVSRRVN